MARDTKIWLNDEVALDLPRLIPSKLFGYANSGYGKSWLLRRIGEQASDKIQQIIIDPEGEFSTLREKHDLLLIGKGKDFDIQADPRTASLLAHRLLHEKVSAVIDLYEMDPGDGRTPGERDQFVANFSRALVNVPKELHHPYLFLVDEAQDFAPENGNTLSHAPLLALAKKGRKRGCCPQFFTQRVADFSKSIIAAGNNKLIGQASLDIDMKRCAAELGFNTKEQLLSLRDLEPGEFFAFGPAIGKTVRKIRVGPVFTSHPDSSKIGGSISTKVVPASAKVKKALAALADLPQAAAEEAKTVAELKQQVKSLATQLRTRSVEKVPQEKIKIVELPVLKDAQIKRLEIVFGNMVKEAEHHGGAMALLWGHFNEVGKTMIGALDAIKKGPERPTVPVRAAPAPKTPQNIPARVNRVVSQDTMSPAKQRILDALAWLSAIGIDKANKVQLAFLADQSPRSSGYSNNLGALRSAGLIGYPAPNEVALTPDGSAAASAPSAPATTDELQERIQSKLPRSQWAILKVLIDQYPNEMTKDDLAAAANQSPTSSGYSNNLGAMRSLGLIDYPSPGRVKAQPILFL